ncbi:MAG TPA: FHA domain-containing protein [Aggregatilineales bacterium]|jgi:hypothetical protein|nr:FHA domain-containing protein [Aggregatilineales bacterium]
MPQSGKTKHLNDETFIVAAGQADRLNAIFERFLAFHTPFGFQSQVDKLVYHPLPYKPAPEDDLLLKEPWRIRFELYVNQKRMHMGLDLYGDVILGRGASTPGEIVVDLDEYDGAALGVSRRHLKLRPTPRHLFAIDQESTNGTTVNGMRLGRGMARALNDEDIINLGNMVLMLRTISHPDPKTAGTTGSLKQLLEQEAQSIAEAAAKAISQRDQAERRTAVLPEKPAPPRKPET